MKFAFALVILLLAGMVVVAQQPRQVPKAVDGYLVVATCGTLAPAYVVGTYQAPTVNPTGAVCHAP